MVDWAPIDQWDTVLARAAEDAWRDAIADAQLPGPRGKPWEFVKDDLVIRLKGHMWIETGGLGNLDSTNEKHPTHWSYGLFHVSNLGWFSAQIRASGGFPPGKGQPGGKLRTDAFYSCYWGARELIVRYGDSRNQWGWDGASRAFFTGNPAPDTTGKLIDTTNGNTLADYLSRLHALIDELRARDAGDTAMDLNFDRTRVPMPPFRYRLATRKVPGVGMDHLGSRVHRGTVFHRGLSGNQTLDNAVDWLLAPTTQGLTDGYIDHRTGEMVIMNPMAAMFTTPPGWRDMAGWANGPYKAPANYPDGRAFRDRYGGSLGASIINQDLESMEVTGNYDTPISEACKATLVQWTASRAQFHRIPWSQFPRNPKDNLTMIYGHREFCGDAVKVCPGGVLWEFVNTELIHRVRLMLRAAQTASDAPLPLPPTPAADPAPVPGWSYPAPNVPDFIRNPDRTPALQDANGVVMFWTNQQYVTTRQTRRLMYADPESKDVGPPIPAGVDINIAFAFTSHNGKHYGLTPAGTRVALDDLKVVSEGALTP